MLVTDSSRMTTTLATTTTATSARQLVLVLALVPVPVLALARMMKSAKTTLRTRWCLLGAVRSVMGKWTVVRLDIRYIGGRSADCPLAFGLSVLFYCLAIDYWLCSSMSGLVSAGLIYNARV